MTGVYIPGAVHEDELLDQFAGLVGQSPTIVHWYQPWGSSFARGAWYQPKLDTDALRLVDERGATPMITWEAWGLVNGSDPSRVRTIPTGVYDTYIDSWAIGLRDFGEPVFLRLFHELNNQTYPWAYGHNGNSATDLIAAWRYVHDRFVRNGALNVIWVWTPTTENTLVPFRAIYPGDEYVDWLGVDGYNGGDIYQDWWGGWASPTDVFQQSIESLTRLDPTKPIMIAETATVEQGGSKAAWIEDLYVHLPRAFPQVRAILWFNAQWGPDDRANWLIESSPESLAAYRTALRRIAPRTPDDITERDRANLRALVNANGHSRWHHLFDIF